MIKIIKVEYSKVDLYTPEGKYISTLDNDLELMHICIQIAEQSLEGYYIIFNDIKIVISSKGELSEWPKGMYDQSMELFRRLFKIRKNHLTN